MAKLVVGINDLATLYPEIGKEWHLIKNAPLISAEVTSGSGKKVWWQCSKFKHHEWDAVVKSRTQRGDRCPFCSNKRVSPENSLSSLYPEIAKEWHPTKNGDLTPDDVVNGSHTKVWWQCSKFKNHEWDARIKDRTRSNGPTGCPDCYKEGRQTSN